MLDDRFHDQTRPAKAALAATLVAGLLIAAGCSSASKTANPPTTAAAATSTTKPAKKKKKSAPTSDSGALTSEHGDSGGLASDSAESTGTTSDNGSAPEFPPPAGFGAAEVSGSNTVFHATAGDATIVVAVVTDSTDLDQIAKGVLSSSPADTDVSETGAVQVGPGSNTGVSYVGHNTDNGTPVSDLAIAFKSGGDYYAVLLRASTTSTNINNYVDALDASLKQLPAD